MIHSESPCRRWNLSTEATGLGIAERAFEVPEPEIPSARLLHPGKPEKDRGNEKIDLQKFRFGNRSSAPGVERDFAEPEGAGLVERHGIEPHGKLVAGGTGGEILHPPGGQVDFARKGEEENKRDLDEEKQPESPGEQPQEAGDPPAIASMAEHGTRGLLRGGLRFDGFGFPLLLFFRLRRFGCFGSF